MGKKGVMTVMWKEFEVTSEEENERENGKRCLCFDGCHRNNQELTGIVGAPPFKKKKNPTAPSSNPTFSLPSHAFLQSVTSKEYNKDPSTSFNLKKFYFEGM
jgi:hypothetical protein